MGSYRWSPIIKKINVVFQRFDIIKWFHQMIPSNDSIKWFHQMIPSNYFIIKQFRLMICRIISIIWNSICIESWRFCTRSLCDLVPPTPILLPLLSVWSFRLNQFICISKSIVKEKGWGKLSCYLRKHWAMSRSWVWFLQMI